MAREDSLRTAPWTVGDAAPAALDGLAEALGPGVQRRAPLAPFMAMRVGGPADLLVIIESLDELARAVKAARRYAVPHRVLGSGCNVLVADRGVRGLVIINRAVSVLFEDRTVRAQSGTRLASLTQRTVDRGLGGLEWAAGLPGTVGGAVVGNAGAFDGDIAGTMRSATVMKADGEIVERENAWFAFDYRSSRLKRQAEEGHVVLDVTFELKQGDEARLRRRAEEVLQWRRDRQPSGATMGSTFKNPPGSYAGQLIERAGLKGLRMGGARISEQHANFLINAGDAKAEDVLALIERAQTEVKRQFGVELALEIELLGWE